MINTSDSRRIIYLVATEPWRAIIKEFEDIARQGSAVTYGSTDWSSH